MKPAIFSALAVGLGLLTSGAGFAQDPAQFAVMPEIDSPSISPNGRWLATRCRMNSSAAVCMYDLQEGVLSYASPVPENAWIPNFYFASDDHFIMSLSSLQEFNLASGVQQQVLTRSMALRPETGESAVLMPRERWSSDTTDIASINRSDPDSILVQMTFLNDGEATTGSRLGRAGGFWNFLYRVDLNTGASRRMDRDGLYHRVIDAQGTDIANVYFDRDSFEYEIRIADREQRVIYTGVHQSDRPSVLGMADAGGLLVFFQSGENYGYQRLDLETGAISRIADLNLDVISSPIFDWDGYLIGFNGERAGIQDQSFTDERYARDVSALENALGRNLVLSSFTADRNSLVLGTSEAGRPNEFYLYEREARALSPINESYPALVGVELPQRRYIRYEASDGLTIPAVLTTPAGWEAGEESLPLVVLPHGGPATRDTLSFDWWAQAYAAQGYLVLQPNFRGSTGYGLEFQQAGYGEFGDKMVQDLIDGARHLQAEGLANPGQYCVAGASYGGYAALRAAVMAPEEVGCVVAFAPVTNPQGMLSEERRMGSFIAFHFWEQYMGDLVWDEETANRVSILQQAYQLTMPVLVLHGEEDGIVEIGESDALRSLMRREETFEYEALEGETHFMVLPSTRQLLLERSLEIMNQTIGQ